MKRFSRRSKNSDLAEPRRNSDLGSLRPSAPLRLTRRSSLGDLNVSNQILEEHDLDSIGGGGADASASAGADASADADDELESVISTPLSESNTLYNTNKERLQLQETFSQNFDFYLPFLLRRLREENRIYRHPELLSSQETVASTKDKYSVFDKPTVNFNQKREFAIVNELFRNFTLVFPSMDSFTLFRNFKNLKKEEANYRAPSFHARGLALPVMKMESHSYIKLEDGADLTFYRFENDLSRTLKFCAVHIKSYTNLRRYTFTFTPLGRRTFKIILFQHNFKPIADFNYRNTRFRVFGGSLVNLGIAPNFKLLIIDKEKPSLCDKLVEKKLFTFLLIVKGKRRSSSTSITSTSRRSSQLTITEQTKVNSTLKGDEDECAVDDEEETDADPFALINPYPEDSNPLLKLNHQQYIAGYGSYISNDLPPFAAFQDAICYKSEYSIFPKKFKEQGKFECYQDLTTFNSQTDINSINSIDTDTLVLACIHLALRDVVNKRNSKISSNMEMVNRYNYIGGMYPASNTGILGI